MMINKIDNKSAFRGVFKTNDYRVVSELEDLVGILGSDDKGFKNAFLLNSHNAKGTLHIGEVKIPDKQSFFVFNDIKDNDAAKIWTSAKEINLKDYDNFEKLGAEKAAEINLKDSQELVNEYMNKAKDITLEQVKNIVMNVKKLAKESLSKVL